MFSYQPCDELDFGTSTTTTTTQSQGYQIPQHESANVISFSAKDSHLDDLGLATNTRAPPRRRPTDRSRHEGGHARRFMHRDIERKRRQEMSNLYLSLRTLLPLDAHFNKGKSSVCDQMEEAEKYIKQMHKKIEEMGSRRDKLKKSYNSFASRRENVEKSCPVNIDDDTLHNSVAIHKNLQGFEILVCNKKPQLELSLVLAELAEQELDVVNCISTRTKEGFLHKLEIEAMDVASLDLSVLQDRLTDTIK